MSARRARHARSMAAGLAILCGTGTAAAEVVAVVSAKSPTTTLTQDQVADIFLGKARRFPDGRLAVPVDQPEGSAARDEFYLAFAGKSPWQLNAHWSKVIFTGRGRPPKIVPDGVAVKGSVVADANAIGYIDQKLLDATVRVILPP